MSDPTEPHGRPQDGPLPVPSDPYSPMPSSGGHTTQPLPYAQPDPQPDPYAQPSGYPQASPQPDPYAQPSGYPQASPPVPYGQPGYQYPPQYPPYQAFDPVTGQPLSDKSKVVAGVLQIALGSFGAGRFYTGHTGMAIAQIAVTWLTCGIGHIWPLIDGIMLLVQGGTDAEGKVLRP